MNKNTKKFVVALLSVLMVLSFMPTMAFAAVTYGSHANGTHNFATTTSVAVNTEGLEVLIAPTCKQPGVGILSCDKKLNDKDCGFTRTVEINQLTHKRSANPVRVTADALMDHMKYTAYEKNYFQTRKGTGSGTHYHGEYAYCECYVYVCDNCGEYLDEGGYVINSMWSSGDAHPHSGSAHYPLSGDRSKHTAPDNTPKCAASFTCSVCGVEKAVNSDFNELTNAAYHNPDTATPADKDLTIKDTVAHKISDTKYVACRTITCNLCGKTWKADPVVHGYGSGETIPHGTTTREVTTEATCTAPGVYEDICNDCGMTVQSGTIAQLNHEYATVMPYEDETDPSLDLNKYVYSAEVCKNCGAVKPNSIKIEGFAPAAAGIETTFTLLADATCEQGAWILQTTTQGSNTQYRVWKDTVIDAELAKPATDPSKLFVKIGDKYYTTADSPKEVPYTPALEHKFGTLTTVAEATCTEGAIEGKICEKCGKVDHATTRETGKPLGHEVTTYTVDPTCGAYGFTYDSCSRCKQIVLPDGAKDTGWMYIDALGKTAQVYNIKDPIVSEGTPCTYEWYVLEPATATKEGKKVLKCTNEKCGHVKEGSETVIPIDPTEADKAADAAIEAATDVLEKKAQYTPDSVEAIKDAIKDLNTARILGDAAAIGRATEKLNQVVAAAVPKKANTMTVKAKTVKAKSKKATTFKKAKAFTVKKAKGKVTFKKVSGNKKISVTSAGKVAVKKGLKKGKTYKVKVMVTAAGNDNYLAKAKTVTLKVKITK